MKKGTTTELTVEDHLRLALEKNTYDKVEQHIRQALQYHLSEDELLELAR